MTNLNRPIVLVIDADPVALTATSAVLACSQYEVHCASSRDAALKAARHLELDLIVCDLDLGGIEGTKILEDIRQLPERSDVPVMFTSACQLPEVIRKSQAQGSVYHLRKPIDPNVLLELTASALWMPHLVGAQINQPHFRFAPNLATMPSTAAH
jgi:two-component system chemotaxis response regulator CheY